MFSSAVFGKIMATADDKSWTIEADPKGWSGSSDLQVCTYVPARYLETMPEGPDPQIILHIDTENGSVAVMGRPYMRIHAAPLFDKTQVLFRESMPGLSVPRPTILESLFDDSATSPMLQTSSMTFTSGLTLRQDSSRTILASGSPVLVTESSACSVNIFCQDYQYRFVFPYPIIARRANIRVNRKVGWIEITVPLASNTDGGYTDNPFPVFGPIEAICDWNMPAVSFKTLAKIDLTNKTVRAWVTKHVRPCFQNANVNSSKRIPQSMSQPLHFSKSRCTIYS